MTSVFIVLLSVSLFLLLKAVDTGAQRSFDFRTRVLTEDRQRARTNHTAAVTVHPPIHSRTRLRLQELVDRRTKPVCTKEVLTKTLITEPLEKLKGNGTNEMITVLTTCCDGFKAHPRDSSRCLPDCGGKCRNGQCVAPNVCQCFPEFVPNLSQDCVTICPLGCINGECLSNGTCLCNAGYQLESKGKYCVPSCGQGCGSGRNCSAPGVCSCYDGYAENFRKECEPICKKDCLHGTCVAPNTCSCYPGYDLKDEICQAACSKKCINGRCISPNHCLCNNGFYYDPNTELCIPRCENCQNGVCVDPEICKCFEGYKNIEDLSTCIPYCTGGCYGGLCYAPEKCDCSFYTINVLEQCRSTGKCVAFFGGVCLWWIDA